MSKKIHTTVVRSKYFIFWRFRSMLCPNLMTMQTRWRYHTLTQRIRANKTFTEYKKWYCCKFTTEDTRSSVECWDHCNKIKTIWKIKGIQHQLSIFCQTFECFVVNLKMLRKSSGFLLLGVSNISLVLKFMKSNKGYYF